MFPMFIFGPNFYDVKLTGPEAIGLFFCELYFAVFLSVLGFICKYVNPSCLCCLFLVHRQNLQNDFSRLHMCQV